MRRLPIVVSLMFALLAIAHGASAQVTPVRRPAPPRPPRKPRTHFIRVSATPALEFSGQTVSQHFTHIRNAENSTTQSSFTLDRAPLYDLGADIRLTPRFALGASGSLVERRSSGDASASIPHPFFFNMPRSVSGTFSDVDGQTIAIHVQLRWFRPIGRRLELSLSGGPSVFQVRQEFVTDVTDGSDYPYDTATFAGVTTTMLTQRVIGFNAGADLTWKLTKHFGVGGMLRYAAANVSFAPVAEAVTFTVGGPQAGGGLRVVF